jgi:hypothetical protein
LNVHKNNNIRQTEIHILLPDFSAFEFEKVTGKLTRHKLPGTDQIPAELNEAGKLALKSINSLILFRIKKNRLSGGRSQLFIFIIIYINAM